MSILNPPISISGQARLRGFAVSCAAMLLLGVSADADTVLGFAQLNPDDVISAIDNGSGTTTMTTTSALNGDGGGLSVPVIVSNFLGTPFPSGFVAYETFVGVTSVGAAGVDPFSGFVEQKFSGTIEFTSGINGTGANYLTAVFSAGSLSPILGGAPGGTQASLSATQPPEQLTLTSDFGTIGPITSMGITFSNVSPSLSISGDGSIASFTGQDAGTFSALSIPEPSSLILGGIGGLIGLGFAWLRHRKSAAI